MTDKCIPCMHLYSSVLRRMAVILCHLLLTLLLSGQGLCQCYSESSCAGDVVSSSDQRDCCVSQNGVSYNDAGTCRPCIGMLVMSTSYTQCLTEPVCSVVHGFRQSVYDINEGARLDTDFSLNVVGTTQFSTLAVSGTITSEAAGTASKCHLLYFARLIVCISGCRWLGLPQFDTNSCHKQ